MLSSTLLIEIPPVTTFVSLTGVLEIQAFAVEDKRTHVGLTVTNSDAKTRTKALQNTGFVSLGI